MTTTVINEEYYPLPTDGEAPHVVFLRGIPASGKSTFAKKHLETHPKGKTVRINNDELSSMLFGVAWGRELNSAVLLENLRIDLLTRSLENASIRLIFIDNTNLKTRTVNQLAKCALKMGAKVTVDDRFLQVSVEECLRRDALRDTPVGERVIRDMAQRAKQLRPWSIPVGSDYDEDTFIASLVPYHNDEFLPSITIVDIDGTLAKMNDRTPFEWHRVGEDAPHSEVVGYVQHLIEKGEKVFIFSGRDSVCRNETVEWLNAHVARDLPLYMRTHNDNRPDTLVKHDLFNEIVRDKYRVRLVLDDRNSVVRLWRGLGLSCWQVAGGDF